MHNDNGMEGAVKNATETGPMGMAKWIWSHNPEHYAAENFVLAREHLKSGAPFEHTNISKGFKWGAWSMKEKMEKERQCIAPTDLKTNGDWSIY
jgi:hypothetical protein